MKKGIISFLCKKWNAQCPRCEQIIKLEHLNSNYCQNALTSGKDTCSFPFGNLHAERILFRSGVLILLIKSITVITLMSAVVYNVDFLKASVFNSNLNDAKPVDFDVFSTVRIFAICSSIWMVSFLKHWEAHHKKQWKNIRIIRKNQDL